MIDIERYRVLPGTPAGLAGRDPSEGGDYPGGKKAGRKAHGELNARLEALQEVLWAQRRERLLVVLQAMDTGGKDGVIRSVFDGVNPQGVKVAAFKRPTEVELAHDYLWRVHPHVPGNGEITIFNRSHYEDVLVVRVHDLVPPERWSRRYEHIRGFEQLLADEGTSTVKLFLHISKEEQKERLQARLDNPDKHWKFDVGDLEERKHWDEYMEAFEVAISETSTDQAPWYVVPANRKWYRDLVVGTILVQTLEGMDLSYPPNEDDLSNVVIE